MPCQTPFITLDTVISSYLTTIITSCSIRHRRPRYLIKTTRDHVRLERNYFGLATNICGRPNAGCSHVRQHVVHSPCNMRRTSGVGTGTSVVYALHSGYRGNRTLIWPQAPHIRRWQPNLLVVPSTWKCVGEGHDHSGHRRCRPVDGFEPAHAKPD